MGKSYIAWTSSSRVEASQEYEDGGRAQWTRGRLQFGPLSGRKKRKRETSEEHNVRNGERKKERRGEAREESGRGIVAVVVRRRGERADAGGCGRERGVLRPTPRSMLSSEVPVGGGCAEFPAVERRTPVFFSPRANPFLFFFLFFFCFFCFFCFPRRAGSGNGNGREFRVRRLYETTRPTSSAGVSTGFRRDQVRFRSDRRARGNTAVGR